MRSVLVLALVGCARSFAAMPAAGPVDAPVEVAPVVVAARTPATHGVPGEAIEYQVSLRGIHVARVTVAVGDPGWVDGRPAIIVRSRAASGGILSMIGSLTWELTTTLDLETGLPLSESEQVEIEFNGKREHDDNTRNWSGRTDLNVHAAAGVLRAWRSQIGATKSMMVVIDSAHIDLELADRAREFVAAANLPAVRYDGIAKSKYPVSVWVSDDAARVPLRMVVGSKWGEIVVELVSYEAPSEP